MKINFFNRFRPQVREDAAIIRKLADNESGCFVKTANGYKELAYDEFQKSTFNFDKVIVKAPEDTKTFFTNRPELLDLRLRFRRGIEPLDILKALRKKIGEFTLLVGPKAKTQEIYTLHLPKDELSNKKALEIAKNYSGEFAKISRKFALNNLHVYEAMYLNFPYRQRCQYKATKDAVKKLGIKDLILDESQRV